MPLLKILLTLLLFAAFICVIAFVFIFFHQFYKKFFNFDIANKKRLMLSGASSACIYFGYMLYAAKNIYPINGIVLISVGILICSYLLYGNIVKTGIHGIFITLLQCCYMPIFLWNVAISFLRMFTTETKTVIVNNKKYTVKIRHLG